MLGCPAGALVGRTSREFEAGGGTSERGERELRREDGSRLWVQVAATRLTLRGGEQGVVERFTDITEEKRLAEQRNNEEERLRESREQLSMAMAASGIGLWDFNPQTGEVAVSPEYAILLGHDPATFRESASLWQERIHPIDLPFVQQVLGDYLSDKIPFFSIEFRMKTAAGGWLWCLSMGRIVRRDEGGRPIRMIGTTQDISERKTAEEERLRLTAIVESSPDFVGIAAMTGEVLYVNQAGRRLLGLDPMQPLSGLKYLDFVSPEEHSRYPREILPALHRTGVWRGESVIRRSDGSEFVADMNRFLIRDPRSHEPILIGNIMRDATDRKRAEEELRTLNGKLEERVRDEVSKNREKDHLLIQQSRLAAMGEMIGNIAHQWRQPLNALGLVVANLEDAWAYDQFSGEYLREQADKATQLIDGMSSTIDDFRNFFRPTKASSVFHLHAETQRALALVRDALSHRGISLTLEGDQGVQVEGYPNEYSQAVLNLVINARDAILAKGTKQGAVRLEIRRHGGEAWLIVEDNGSGIPPDVLPRIFDPYFTTRDKGTGIGLYMTRTIIETNMRGHIEAASTTDGARFTVRLPTAAPTQSTRSEAAAGAEVGEEPSP